MEKSGEELQNIHIIFRDGREMTLEALIEEYEELLSKPTVSELKVGVWFRIDREVINKRKEKIRRKCEEAGAEGKKLWERFEESNEIADKNPEQYPRLIETYIFRKEWFYRTVQQMRDMCEKVGDGMCDEIICDLELQMRICNGEHVDDLVKKTDKLPLVRVVKLRNGGTGYLGGGVRYVVNRPPADLHRTKFYPDYEDYDYTPYAFRRVLS